MKKLILTMNKEEFCETIEFMYEVYNQVKYMDNSIHSDSSPTLVAYMSYYNEPYNELFESFVREEAYIVKNILLFIDIVFTKTQLDGFLDPSIKNYYTLPKTIEMAYIAVKYNETRQYFQMATFPKERGKNIISTILKTVDPDYQIMVM